MGVRANFISQKGILRERGYKIGDQIIILFDSYKRLCKIIEENDQIKFFDIKDGTKYAFSMILTTRNYKKKTVFNGDLRCNSIKCEDCPLRNLKNCDENEDETFFEKIEHLRISNKDLFLYYYDILKKPFKNGL